MMMNRLSAAVVAGNRAIWCRLYLAAVFAGSRALLAVTSMTFSAVRLVVVDIFDFCWYDVLLVVFLVLFQMFGGCLFSHHLAFKFCSQDQGP
jgi:hypothetical protein